MAQNENQILNEIRDVHNQLSPENLSCDGECSHAETRQREKILRSRLHRLEQELGRKPTEQEIWHLPQKPAKPIVPAGGVYLELFHGRKNPKQQMDDWGEHGPVFGPFQFVHTTYAVDLKMQSLDGQHFNLEIARGLIFYGGLYYGDWSVFDAETFRKCAELQSRHQVFDQEKARR